MNLETARANVGQGVVYYREHRPVEAGVITSVNDRYVFVRYGADRGSKATDPMLLELENRS